MITSQYYSQFHGRPSTGTLGWGEGGWTNGQSLVVPIKVIHHFSTPSPKHTGICKTWYVNSDPITVNLHQLLCYTVNSSLSGEVGGQQNMETSAFWLLNASSHSASGPRLFWRPVNPGKIHVDLSRSATLVG